MTPERMGGMFRFKEIIGTVLSTTGSVLFAVADIGRLYLSRFWG